MAAELPTGRAIPGLDDALDSVKAAGISLPISVGLLVVMMMCPRCRPRSATTGSPP